MMSMIKTTFRPGCPYELIKSSKKVMNQVLRPMCCGTGNSKYSHTDIKVPDFTNYRRDAVKDPCTKTHKSEDSRRLVMAVAAATAWTAALYATKSHVFHYVSSMAASAEVLALAKMEIDLTSIPEGITKTYKWRGKPIFVKHRTQEEIQLVRADDTSLLRHPEEDQERVKRDDWLVVTAICTHLGCVPHPNSGDFPGGFYCPCHGSHYDASGRARKGPAPLNLEVPEHNFVSEDKIVVG